MYKISHSAITGHDSFAIGMDTGESLVTTSLGEFPQVVFFAKGKEDTESLIATLIAAASIVRQWASSSEGPNPVDDSPAT